MISGVIIVQNEEANIETCINNLKWVDEIVIVDGGSTDKTIPIITDLKKDFNIRLYKNKFTGHFGDQKNLAISLTTGDWVFVLDADETIEDGLVEELTAVSNLNKVDVVAIPRKNYIDGLQTDAYPDYQLRFFRAYCRYVLPVHEELVGWKKSYLAKSHILHSKTAQKQDTQNSLYSKNASIFSKCSRSERESKW